MMNTASRRIAMFSVGMLVGMAMPVLAQAQEFPGKTIRMVVPNSPGTPVDIMARLMAPDMAKDLGQPVVVENRAGASYLVGLEYVARQPADGYTIAAVSVTSMAILPATEKDLLRFDPLKDLPPFIGVMEGRLVVGSASTFPWKTLDELTAYGKANPGKLNYGSSSATVRLSSEAVIGDRGLSVTYVPYSGGGAYLQALVAGEVQMGFLAESAAMQFGDRFRILAVTGEQRSANFPGVPTFAELGHPQIRGLGNSLNARAGTPAAVLTRLHAAASRTLRQPDVKALFAKNQFDISEQAPEVAMKRLLDEASVFSAIARKAGIQPR